MIYHLVRWWAASEGDKGQQMMGVFWHRLWRQLVQCCHINGQLRAPFCSRVHDGDCAIGQGGQHRGQSKAHMPRPMNDRLQPRLHPWLNKPPLTQRRHGSPRGHTPPAQRVCGASGLARAHHMHLIGRADVEIRDRWQSVSRASRKKLRHCIVGKCYGKPSAHRPCPFFRNCRLMLFAPIPSGAPSSRF